MIHQLFDRRYEIRAVTALSFGFGLVGVDRFLIAPLFPTMMVDMHLDYQDLGAITAALSISWGLSALFIGSLSDRFGRRLVVIGSLVAFSLLIGLSGLAASVAALIAARALMGVADGAYTSASIAATVDASAPSRHGLNLGLQQMMAPLLGLAATPILVTRLLTVINWRLVFPLLAVPGLLLAIAMFFILRDQHPQRRTATAGRRVAWREVLGNHNVPVLMFGMLCWLTCLIVTSALLPSYLIDRLRLTSGQMGIVMSAIGFGAAAGCLVLPAISDWLGRKPVVIFATLSGAIASFALSRVGGNVELLFTFLFLTHFFNFALITLTVGPISTESVPVAHMATASGLIICVGELFGGGVAPVLAGAIAKHFGIEHILSLATGALVAGFIVMLFLRETAPNAFVRGAARQPNGVR